MLLNHFKLHTPKSSLEAAQLLGTLEEAKIIAGGTFIMNSMKLLKVKGSKSAKNVISLAKAEDLKGVSLANGVLTIKAMTTVTELKASPLLKDNLAVLAIVCKNISTNPIRNMATIGGNLTCRYTWTEMVAVMIALDAQMHFLSAQGKETIISAEDFFKNAARTSELFTHVTIKHDPHVKAVYQRVKKTLHMDTPFLAMCFTTKLNGKQWSNTRVGVNSTTAFAQRDYILENFLNSSQSSPDLPKQALDHLTKEIYDTRSSDYKQHMFRVCIKRSLQQIVDGIIY